MRHTRFIIVAILAWFATAAAVQAEEYVITYTHNCKYVKIGSRKVYKGGRFDSSEKMTLRPRQFFRARSTATNEEKTFYEVAFRKHGVTTINDLLTKEKAVYTRSYGQSAPYYKDLDHYLADSLHVEAFSRQQDNVVAEAVWKQSGKPEVVTTLERTPDGRFYIVTPAIFKKHKPCDVKLTIRERTADGSWTDLVYQDFPIVVVPKSAGKAR